MENKLDILELLACGVIICDCDLKILKWNQAIVKMTGVKKSQAIGKNLESLVSKAVNGDKEKFMKEINGCLANNENFIPTTELIHWKDFWFIIDVDYIGFENKCGRCMITLIDVTQVQSEVIRLGEENGKLIQEKRKATISDGWIRKTILIGLFVSVIIFVIIALVADSLDLTSSANVFTVVTGLTNSLSLAIGYYFNNGSKNDNHSQQVDPYYPQVGYNPQESLNSLSGVELGDVKDLDLTEYL